jgi:hypothetical protein
MLRNRVARFSLEQYTKFRKIHQTAANCRKWPYHLQNNYKVYQIAVKLLQNFPFQGLPQYTNIGIFGLQINHLATPIRKRCTGSCAALLELLRKTRLPNRPQGYNSPSDRCMSYSLKAIASEGRFKTLNNRQLVFRNERAYSRVTLS